MANLDITAAELVPGYEWTADIALGPAPAWRRIAGRVVEALAAVALITAASAALSVLTVIMAVEMGAL